MDTTVKISNYINFVIEGEELLRLEKDAFYVRGERVTITENQAMEVYNSFSQWLAWAQLQRQNG